MNNTDKIYNLRKDFTRMSESVIRIEENVTLMNAILEEHTRQEELLHKRMSRIERYQKQQVGFIAGVTATFVFLFTLVKSGFIKLTSWAH